MSLAIPILDLGAQYATLRDEIEAAALRVLRSGRYVLGPEVQALETEIGSLLEIDHVVSCASGTDALVLALRALEIGPGDEVIVPAFTFAASAEAVALCGARPVFVDIDPDSFLIDPVQCRQAVTPHTRAVVVVHLFGHPVDVVALQEAVGPEVALVEDCAQSFGAHIQERATGTLGRVSTFSFFPSKNLGGCGDGGAVATGDAGLAQRLRALRNHGSSESYKHDMLGLNSRLDELQAAILRVKLPYLKQWNDQRRRVAHRYTEKTVHTGWPPDPSKRRWARLAPIHVAKPAAGDAPSAAGRRWNREPHLLPNSVAQTKSIRAVGTQKSIASLRERIRAMLLPTHVPGA